MENKDDNIVYWSDMKKNLKVAKAKAFVRETYRKGKEKATEAVKFAKENPGAVVGAVCAINETAKIGLRVADRIDRKKQERVYYDHSTQQHIRTKKRLSNKQKLEAFRIHQETGRPYVEIYKEMGVL